MTAGVVAAGAPPTAKDTLTAAKTANTRKRSRPTPQTRLISTEPTCSWPRHAHPSRRLKQLALADPERALAWIELASSEATRNPAGFVIAGLESGDWPAPRGLAATTLLRQLAWVTETSWQLTPEHAHEIVDDLLGTLDAEAIAELHRLVDQERKRRRLAEEPGD